ncbi:MAG: OPT family oligopeptide transporter [Myxococcales bacterium]|nr:OPT family oligopeptide transporter [Myxococcales bacterium]
MAIKQLTPEQIRTFTPAQKDAWWLENIFRGDMPQLTLRAAIVGFCLGGVLSATNLYIGAKTGWTLGVGLTSVILTYATFRSLTRFGVRDMTILENNASQSVATAAGYMTGPLISGMTAYMWVQNALIPWWQMTLFNVVLSLLGVLVAFPMKRRFINEEQQPFPEGQACGVVLDALYSTGAEAGMYKAKLLAKAAGIAAAVGFVTGENLMAALQQKVLRLKSAWHLPHNLDAFYYWMVDKGWVPEPRLAGASLRQLGVSPSLDLAMFGAGGLMGFRSGASMLLGMILNFIVVVPSMIAIGEIRPKLDGTFSRVHVLNNWALWWGIVIMVVASLVGLFAKPEVLLQAFRGLGKKRTEKDVVSHIELPLIISFIGVPIIGFVGAWMANAWFGVSWIFGLTSIPLIIVLTLIATSSTALTGITPTGSLSKIPQFAYGALDPTHPPTNLMTGVMCVEVASNASNLLMDIKPGYMLGAKPRQQAVGHAIGVFAGALASTPLFYLLFLSDYAPGKNVQAVMAPENGQFGFPSALQWKGVSELVTAIFGGTGSGTLLTNSIITSMVVAAVAGLVMEIARIKTRGRFPLSPLAIGLGVVIPPDSTMAMFAGAAFFAYVHKRHGERVGTPEHARWIGGHEPMCAGLIAGAALMGIADILVKVFLL